VGRRVDLEVVLEAVGGPRVADADASPTRDRIIDAALACFVERGVRATTMSDVAEGAGLSRVWVHRLVGSKTDLVHAVLTREVEAVLVALAAAASPDHDPVDGFSHATGLVVAHFAAHPLVRRFVDDEADQVVAAFTDGRFLSLVAERITTLAAPALSTTTAAARPVIDAAVRVAVSLMIAPVAPGGDGAEEVAHLMEAAFGPALRALPGC